MKRQGYEKLIVWQNAYKLRKLIYETTGTFPKKEIRRVSQMNDAARSVKQNIQEGYKRNSLGDYIRSLNIAQGSLGELMGDVDDCYEDKLITEERFDKIKELLGKTDYLFKRLIQSLEKKRRLVRKNGGK
ncbi:MAG: four helix bundle protein [Candidatus Omnitrophica bacterium]|nr:four helix bundle protein [Candidatus Omnitrophota bacterium]